MAVDYSTIILEDNLAIGFRGSPVWENSRVSALSGWSQRNQQRARPVHQFSYSSAETDLTTLQGIRGFHTAVRGSLSTWLLKDWTNYSATNELLGTGDNVETDFQIVKNEGNTANPYVRTIQYTKSGTLAVYVDDVLQSTPAQYTVTATGLIQFVTAPGSGLDVTADYEFYIPVSFLQDECFIELIERDGNWGVISTLDAIEELPQV